MAEAEKVVIKWVVVKRTHFPFPGELPISEPMDKDKAQIECDLENQRNLLIGVTYVIEPREAVS